MKKLIIFLLLIPTLVYAQQTRTDGDCKNLSYLITIKPELSSILNEKNAQQIIDQALTNLQKYCLYQTDTLQTPYFLNHLLDIYFRYLDGIPTENYNGPFYPESIQYRKQLTKLAEQNFNGVNPSIITQLHKLFIEKIAPKYEKFCSKIPKINALLTNRSINSEPAGLSTTAFMKTCYQAAQIRVYKENNLLQSIAVKLYNTSYESELFKIFKTYASKWNNLYNIFVIALGDFEYLMTKFIKVTSANTK